MATVIDWLRGTPITLAPWASVLVLLDFLAAVVMFGVYAGRQRAPPRWWGIPFLLILLIIVALGHQQQPILLHSH